MSRSYKKVLSLGICAGSNTLWYKKRRQRFANSRKHQLRNLMANYTADAVSEMIYDIKYPKRDTWYEPTDGRQLWFSKPIKGLAENKWLRLPQLERGSAAIWRL